MFYLKKVIEVSASHYLNLPYKSECNQLHGHNYIVEIYCKGNVLNNCDMIVDFNEISTFVKNTLDHKDLNDVFQVRNPTAEVIARYLVTQIECCYKCTIRETQNSEVTYIEDEIQDN